jgi:hypothetical protein
MPQRQLIITGRAFSFIRCPILYGLRPADGIALRNVGPVARPLGLLPAPPAQDPGCTGTIGLSRLVPNEAFKMIGGRRENFRQGLTLDLREPGLVQGGDQKVVNFEQILFANGRMLDLREGASSKGVRAFNLAF